MSRSASFIGVTILALITGAADAERPVDLVIGESQFFNGDMIDILSVTSSGAGFEQGATVTVEGTYKLNTTESALLGFNSTKRLKPGEKPTPTPGQPNQSTTARKGVHVFVLSKVITDDGSPHLTFYHPVTGKPFGGVYFGDESNVMMKKSWSYEPAPASKAAATSKVTPR